MPVAAQPSSEVWTTIAWDGNNSLLAVDLHFKRIARHSDILGIIIPDDMPKIVFNKLAKLSIPGEIEVNDDQAPFLVKLIIDFESQISLSSRINKIWPTKPLEAISMMAPNLELPILGTKNGAWQYYIDAREQAAIHGADIALLFLDNFLIDGDKCTPIILDHDGVAYHPKNTDGALDSITLEQIKEGIEISGIPVRGAKISLDMLFRASEMIVLGSGLGVCSLGKIDGRKIGNPKGKLYKAAKETWIQRLKSGWLGFDDLEG